MEGRVNRGSIGEEPAPVGSAGCARGRGLTFINAAHPTDALSRQALSDIRAHVARDAHARGRRVAVRSARSARRHSSPSGGSGSTRVATLTAEESSTGFAAPAPSTTWRDTSDQSLTAAAPDSRRRHEACSPNDVAWSWDPFQSLVRPLSDTEAFLIDHYVNYAIEYDRACCESADRAMRAMLRGAWVPFALSDEGALAAVLTQACRSVLEVLLLPRQPGTRRLVAAASSSSSGAHATTPAEAYYSRLMLLYKGLCIRSTNVSLSLEWPHVSDATIAKSVMMGTEERIAGNMDAWLVHAFAVARMTEQRGGPSRLGLSGFLTLCAGNCIALAQRFREQCVNHQVRCATA